jgi:hypothetical protein
MYALSSLGKEAELIEKTTEETERNADNALLEPPPASDVSMNVASTDQTGPPSNVRRLRRARRDSLGTELDLIDETVSRGDGSSGTDGSNGHTNLDRAARQLARAQKGERSRSPRTEGTSGALEDANAGAVELANGSLPATDASATTPEGLVINSWGRLIVLSAGSRPNGMPFANSLPICKVFRSTRSWSRQLERLRSDTRNGTRSDTRRKLRNSKNRRCRPSCHGSITSAPKTSLSHGSVVNCLRWVCFS